MTELSPPLLGNCLGGLYGWRRLAWAVIDYTVCTRWRTLWRQSSIKRRITWPIERDLAIRQTETVAFSRSRFFSRRFFLQTEGGFRRSRSFYRSVRTSTILYGYSLQLYTDRIQLPGKHVHKTPFSSNIKGHWYVKCAYRVSYCKSTGTFCHHHHQHQYHHHCGVPNASINNTPQASVCKTTKAKSWKQEINI